MNSPINSSYPVRVIIFSRDRAMQLDAALRSFFLYCQDAELAKVYVLYMATDARHQLQYDALGKAYPQVFFKAQNHFRTDVLKWLNPYTSGNPARMYQLLGRIASRIYAAGRWPGRFFQILIGQHFLRLLPQSEDKQFVLFMVDDNLFVRKFKMQTALSALQQNPCAIGFSLRLGVNTTYCYMLHTSQALPPFSSVTDEVLKYNWTLGEYDFNYPLEISSSIYRLDQIAAYILGFNFDHPNALESEMASHSKVFSKEYPMLLCYGQSVAFCNPVNIVQQSNPNNRAAQQIAYSVDELTARFEKGERIRVELFNDFIPIACHQEVLFDFEKREDPLV